MSSLNPDDREHAWVLFQVLNSTRRAGWSQDDVIAHVARVLADARGLEERSGARFTFEVDVAAAICVQLRKEMGQTHA